MLTAPLQLAKTWLVYVYKKMHAEWNMSRNPFATNQKSAHSCSSPNNCKPCGLVCIVTNLYRIREIYMHALHCKTIGHFNYKVVTMHGGWREYDRTLHTVDCSRWALLMLSGQDYGGLGQLPLRLSYLLSGRGRIQKVRGLKYSAPNINVYVLMIFTAFLLKSGAGTSPLPPLFLCPCYWPHIQLISNTKTNFT